MEARMRKTLTAVLLVTIAVAGGLVARAQAPVEISMEIDVENGAARPILQVRDGEIARLFIYERTFGFRPTTRDMAEGRVRVTILDGAAPDSPILAEVDAALGEPPVPSGTSPAFA